MMVEQHFEKTTPFISRSIDTSLRNSVMQDAAGSEKEYAMKLSAVLYLLAGTIRMALAMAAFLGTFSAVAQTEFQTTPRADTRAILDQATNCSAHLPERTRDDQTMTKDNDPRLRPIEPIQVEPIEQAQPPTFQAILMVAALGVVTWYFVGLALPLAAGSVVALLAANSLAPLNAIYLGILTASAMWVIYRFAFHRFVAASSRRLLIVSYALMVSIWCYMLLVYALEQSVALHSALHHWGAIFCSAALGAVSIARLTTGRANSASVE